MAVQDTYLSKIIAAKRASLADAAKSAPMDRATQKALEQAPPTRDFIGALRVPPRPRVIAEFKRASPSEGELRAGADPREIAAAYVDAGAACMSVLTDSHFQGSFDDLRAVREAVDLPLLCKDFVLSRSQIVQARLAGADCILLIVAALEAPLLRELFAFATDLGLHVLCEAHDEQQVDRAMAAGARLVGVNARDLRTFQVDLERAARLRARVPASFTYVAESGIRGKADMALLRQAGVDAVLVGSHLMRAPDPGLALMDLMSPA